MARQVVQSCTKLLHSLGLPVKFHSSKRFSKVQPSNLLVTQMHHLHAFRAWYQLIDLVQMTSNLQQEQTFNTFLSLLNVSTIKEARQLPSNALIGANTQQIGASPYGLFTYGPVVDGLFTPALPGKLLLQGSFDRDLKLILGHNADEGLVFTSPFITNSSAYETYVKSVLVDISPGTTSFIVNSLYPPPSKSTPYKDNIGRTTITISDSSLVCNTNFLARVCSTYLSRHWMTD